jgi:hypothetical protein
MLLLSSTRGMSSLRTLPIARIWSLGISIEWEGVMLRDEWALVLLVEYTYSSFIVSLSL